MHRDEAMKLLRAGPSGVEEWNRRLAGGEDVVDLKNAFLINADLRGVDLRGTYLVGASFSQADLRRADLSGAQLSGADFRGADLRDADFRHANLSNAVFGHTLISCDLSQTGGLDSVVHLCRSIVDIHSVLCFRDPMPVKFLRGCGLSEEEIVHFQERAQKRLRLASCFLSYCSTEETFAARLHNDLQAAGIRCWKWNHEAQVCEELLALAGPTAGTGEKIVLLASRHSLTYDPVNEEISRIIEEENRRADSKALLTSPGEVNILQPVRVDNFFFDRADDGTPYWNHPYREAVINRPILDAVGWDTKREKYLQARKHLIRTLTTQAE
jgi:hypothetical protein